MDRIEKLNEFLKTAPDDPFLQHALALELIKQGNDGAARSLFERILARDPGYVGSYYHLCKLLERAGDVDSAAMWYEKGMHAARTAGDQHALNELRMAYDDLMDS